MTDTLSAVLIDTLPEPLHARGAELADTLFACLSEKDQHKLITILGRSDDLAAQLARALVGSQYVVDSCCCHPDLLINWLLVDPPYAPLSAERIVDMVTLSCCDCDTVEQLDQVLRQLRRQLMLAIIWRDLNGLSDFAELCQCMSAMAEVCIGQALDFHYQRLCEQHGVPIGAESSQPQQLLVLGMGKLGGAELNVSSDIDLLFVFPESGQTQHPSKVLDNQQFFTRLGQRLIKTLNESRSDGFVFRVDMRLRPYGQSGALVSSFAALENYYETQGRDWERFAAIKARVVACTTLADPEQSFVLQQHVCEQLDQIIQPFIYRKYTDFSVIESLRKLKAMIVQEVHRKGMQGNVKLGAGGIRELEFIVQSFQLIRGGRDLQLQQRHWLEALQQLQSCHLFSAEIADKLRTSYLFLRKVEHALQAYQDQQTQQLPSDNQQQRVLAWLMGFSDWASFEQGLQQHRDTVSQEFQEVIATPGDNDTSTCFTSQWLSFWENDIPDHIDVELDTADMAQPITWLQSQGYCEPQHILQQLAQLKNSWSIKQLSSASRESLDLLIPQILTMAAPLSDADTTLLRMLVWLEKIVGRSSYITFLIENPGALNHLARLFQGSVWVAELLAQMPSLLDELLDPQLLYRLPTKNELHSELRQRLLRIEPDDLEAQMDVLRYFKLSHSLRVAASDLGGRLPLMNISDYLTWIAEAVLEEVLHIAWQQLSAKHGVPNNGAEALEGVGSGFVIVAYGKMGGIELSYSSDLDLVFVYQGDPQSMSNGKHPVDPQTFYTRLGQKIIHILNTQSLSGPLYEVDMRLRPSGNSGMLVSSLEAFARYQRQDAWTWEHQALVRARPIAGDASLMQEFEQIRRQVLEQPRDLPQLCNEVIQMRQKMRDHLGASNTVVARQQAKNHENSPKKPLFHLKQDAGGIVDIEFMVQYAVLAWAHQRPEFAKYTDNIRILEYLRSSGCIKAEDIELLITVYQSYREVSHRLSLQKQSSLMEEPQLSTQFASYHLAQKRQQIQQLWQQWLCHECDF